MALEMTVDLAWRFKSMEVKGWRKVPPSELAFAISNAENMTLVNSGLDMLAHAWGKIELADMLVAKVGSKTMGVMSGKKAGTTVMSTVVSEIVIHEGHATDNWARLGVMLALGANPDVAPQGCPSSLDKALQDVSYAGAYDEETLQQAVSMMLARSSLVGSQSWVTKAVVRYPKSAGIIQREWSLREMIQLRHVTPLGRLSKEAPRL